MKRFVSLTLAALLAASLFTGCASEPKTIKFADVGWDSIKFHNAVAGFIAVSAFSYASWEEVSGSTPVTHLGVINGEIDVHMEIWTDNLPSYKEDIAADKLKELSVNFDDNQQGFYVPRYVIEGDQARGIAPVAPDLKTVEDLKKYADVFKDADTPSKGRLYGAIPGWEIDDIMNKKYLHYGLDEMYVYFRPGTEVAMVAAFTSAYEKGEPIVGYYWEPTWLLGKYDFILLEDAPYNEDEYFDGKTACPAVRVCVGSSNAFYKNDPDFCKFLANYQTSSALTSEALAYMQDTGADYEQTAKWFLTEHDELLSKFLDPDRADKVRAALS